MPSKKLPILPSYTFKEKENAWEENRKKAARSHPLKTLPHIPSIPGITKTTARFLKIKSLFYLLSKDKKKVFTTHFWKHPFKYGAKLLLSYARKKSFTREDDLFFYGLKNLCEFKTALSQDNSLLILGFSYCHKPLECPSGRFSSSCQNTPSNPVCSQCFIGKMCHLIPPHKAVIPLFIPTIHYIGEKMFEITEQHPNKKIVFLITACEMTLNMFGDWGNMIGALGIGVRLDGRICNTMKAFLLSEEGIKPGLTTVLPETEKILVDILSSMHTHTPY